MRRRNGSRSASFSQSCSDASSHGSGPAARDRTRSAGRRGRPVKQEPRRVCVR
jgi:hypothetical protein